MIKGNNMFYCVDGYKLMCTYLKNLSEIQQCWKKRWHKFDWIKLVLSNRCWQNEMSQRQRYIGCPSGFCALFNYTEQKYKHNMSSVDPMFHEWKWKIPEMFHTHKKLISIKWCAQMCLHPCYWAFLLCQDNPSIWQVWHIKKLSKQNDHCTGAPYSGDNKRLL